VETEEETVEVMEAATGGKSVGEGEGVEVGGGRVMKEEEEKVAVEKAEEVTEVGAMAVVTVEVAKAAAKGAEVMAAAMVEVAKVAATVAVVMVVAKVAAMAAVGSVVVMEAETAAARVAP
jgi:hypothetical protein